MGNPKKNDVFFAMSRGEAADAKKSEVLQGMAGTAGGHGPAGNWISHWHPVCVRLEPLCIVTAIRRDTGRHVDVRCRDSDFRDGSSRVRVCACATSQYNRSNYCFAVRIKEPNAL